MTYVGTHVIRVGEVPVPIRAPIEARANAGLCRREGPWFGQGLVIDAVTSDLAMPEEAGEQGLNGHRTGRGGEVPG